MHTLLATGHCQRLSLNMCFQSCARRGMALAPCIYFCSFSMQTYLLKRSMRHGAESKSKCSKKFRVFVFSWCLFRSVLDSFPMACGRGPKPSCKASARVESLRSMFPELVPLGVPAYPQLPKSPNFLKTDNATTHTTKSCSTGRGWGPWYGGPGFGPFGFGFKGEAGGGWGLDELAYTFFL